MPTIKQARTIEEMWGAGESVSLMSKATGLSHAATRRYIHDHVDDCPPRLQRAFSATERQFIVRAWNKGATVDQISEALSVRPGSIRTFIQNNRDKCPFKSTVKRRLAEERRAEEELARMRETERRAEDAIDAIVRAYESGMSSREIAAMYDGRSEDGRAQLQ